MTGIAAIAISAAFTSCSKDSDVYNSNYQKEKTQLTYNEAFLNYVDGYISPTQDWGFGTNAKASTRAAEEFGWEVSEGYDAPFTKEYFDAIQIVMPEKETTTANSDYEFLSAGPFEFSIIFSNTSASDEVGYYYYKAEDGIDSRTEVKFKDSSDSPINYFQYGQPDWSGKIEWKTATEQAGFQIWGWGATQVHAKVFTINVPAGYRVGFYIENKSAGYPRTYSNKSLNGDGESYSAVVEQVEGTLAGTFLVGLEDWKRDQGGDNDCNDIIFSVNKGTTPPVVIDPDEPDPVDPEEKITEHNYTVRVIGEDLTFGEDVDADFDFNDVVFDVALESNSTWIKLKAAGGTLPLIIGVANPQDDQDYNDHEVHHLFGLTDTGVMINTNASAKNLRGADLDDFEFELTTAYSNAKEIPVYVKKNGQWVELKAVQGEPASKIGVGTDFIWCDEQVSLKKEHILFVDWVQGKVGSTVKWY